MGRLLDIIIPTWNNPAFLTPCLQSIINTGVLDDLARLLIVNNGQQDIKALTRNLKNVEVLEPGSNLGWERGLEYGLKHSEAPFVVFQNDDTHIPGSNFDFYQRLLTPFSDGNVAAVGPMTTVAAGWHSIFREPPLRHMSSVPFLIFFTVMLRRSDYDAVGGIDTSCVGGDDIDLSMRLRAAGKKLLINPSAFLIHHGFKSGERLRGDQTVKGGWNSNEMREETNQWLIQKHGFQKFIGTMQGAAQLQAYGVAEDVEGKTVADMVTGAKVVELGCGYRKTVPYAIGVDRIKPGEHIPHVGEGCVADIQADVTQPLPFPDQSQDTVIARHILEHCLDSVATLRNWNRILKTGGRLIIAVPNEAITQGIPLNPEHCHAFTPASLQNLMESTGFRHVQSVDPGNGISFVGCFEKVLHAVPTESEALTLA